MHGIAALPDTTVPAVRDLRPPERPGPGQLLCRTRELGICGTDREILKSARPWTPPGESFLILGHECLGEVIEVGSGVTEYAAGDLVVPQVRRPLDGARHRVDMLAFGQFTERGIVCEHGFSASVWLDEPRFVYRVPREIAPWAVLAEPLAVVEKGIHEALLLQRARLGDDAWSSPPPRVLVTGLGPIGFAAAVSARWRNWPTTVYGRDGDDTFRAGLVRELGASYINDHTANFTPDDVEQDGYDLVLECTGSDELTLQASSAVASRGVVVWLGSARVPEPRTLNVERLMRDGLLRNHLYIGSVNAAPRDFRSSLQLLGELRTTLGPTIARIITRRVGFDDALWHYEHREPQGIKVVVEYDGQA